MFGFTVTENVCRCYHCVKQVDASLQAGFGITVHTEKKPSNRLLLTDAVIVLLCSD